MRDPKVLGVGGDDHVSPELLLERSADDPGGLDHTGIQAQQHVGCVTAAHPGHAAQQVAGTCAGDANAHCDASLSAVLLETALGGLLCSPLRHRPALAGRAYRRQRATPSARDANTALLLLPHVFDAVRIKSYIKKL